jgi:hypothetical protein
MVIADPVIVTPENFERSPALRLRSDHIVTETRVNALRWFCRRSACRVR